MAKKVKENKVENKRATFSPAIADLITRSVKPNDILRYGEGETELAIEVSHTVSVAKKAEAIKMSVNLLFQDNAESVNDYIPAYKEFAKRYGVLMAYTNLVLPTDLSSVWATLLYTPIYADVVKILGECTVHDFTSDFDELVEARKQEIINSINWNKILNKILDKIEKMPSVLSEILKNIDLKGLEIEKIVESIKGMQGIERLGLDNLLQVFANK